MSIPSLVAGRGNNEACRVPNETNRQPPLPTCHRVLRKFGFFLLLPASPCLPLFRSHACPALDMSFIKTLCQRLHLFHSQQQLRSTSRKVSAANPNWIEACESLNRVEFNQCDCGMKTKSSTASPGASNQVSLVKCVLSVKQKMNKT